MSKIKNKNIEKLVMQEIEKGNVKMKPRWLFAAGSVVAMAGLIASAVTSVFLVNLIIFLVKKQGPGVGRLDMMLTAFPAWVPVVAVLGVISGIFLLRKYDFSYKKNFALIALAFIVSILVAGFVIDKLGINEAFLNKGVMRGVYRIDPPQGYFQGRGGQGNPKNGYNRNR